MHSNFAQFEPDVEALGLVSDFVNEFIDVVKTESAFEAFTAQETETLTEYMECFGVPTQSTVMREGTEVEFLAILVTGAANILKGYQGGQKVVHQVKPGEFVGETVLFDGQKRFASCVTTQPSDFAVLSSSSLNALLADHPQLANKFLLMLLRLTSSRLQKSTIFMLPGLRDDLV